MEATPSADDPSEELAEAPDLNRRFSGELQVHGSCGLAQTLIENDLTDEYRLLTFPVILGTGKRLFGVGAVPTSLRLVSSHTTGAGVVIRVYRRAGGLKTGSFELPASAQEQKAQKKQDKQQKGAP